MVDPLENTPGVTPSTRVPQYGPDQKEVGAQDETQKQFQLPGADEDGTQTKVAGYPSPMDVARDASQGSQRMSPEELGESITKLHDNLTDISQKLKDPSVINKLTEDHMQAMRQVIDKMNPEMRTIATHSKGEFQPNKIGDHDVVGSVVKWINGSQQALGGALKYLGGLEGKQPSLGSFMKLQYSVQRASQRGELFASIIGSSVSGIKTIMSTQLG